MPYPASPFAEGFDFGQVMCGDFAGCINVNEIRIMGEWLCRAPGCTTFRVNSMRNSREEVRDLIQRHIDDTLARDIEMTFHLTLPDAIILHHPVQDYSKPYKLKQHQKEIIVDIQCGAAILRGAHVYAPGVMGMMTGTTVGDSVSIYADPEKKCKKGLQKLYDNTEKILVANGVAKMTRDDLFRENETKTTGIAVQVVENGANCPPLGDNFLPPGSALLQNLPSIVCVHVLDPQPDETILDMCASPGNKTTHIASLMKQKGRLIAIDKTPSKVRVLRERCQEFGSSVEIIQQDSTKFEGLTFDRILLDAPCSGLGKRPQLANSTSVKVLRSYVPLQRKLFTNAVNLLRPGGFLVYSTCTITVPENEGLVAWALKTFPQIKLVESEPFLGGPGIETPDLSSPSELRKVQRFGPGQEIDSVGFFIAKFVKDT